MRVAARRRPEAGFSFIELLVVMGIIVMLLGMVVGVIPLITERGNQTKSKDNVKQLLTYLLDMKLSKGGYPPYSGKCFTLSPIAYGMIDPEGAGSLDVFFSPGDQFVTLGKVDKARYKEVNKNNLKAGTDFNELTSYAGRMNAVKDCLLIDSAQSAKDTLCLCDDDDGPLHHSGGLVVGFSSGKADYWDWDDLGMSKPSNVRNPDPFLGESATSDLLRCVSRGN